MRKQFAEYITAYMRKDPSIRVILGGVGYGVWDEGREEFPDRIINIEASEQAGVDIAVGMAISGLNPIFYTITPFLLCRPFESIRLYLNHEKIPVKLVGCGRGDDYKDLGFTHYGGDDKEILAPFKNIKKYWPTENLKETFDEVINSTSPCYLNLSRS